VGDLFLVALDGPPAGPLAAETERAQHLRDVGGMVVLAGALHDQFGDPGQRPHGRRVTVRHRTLEDGGGQFLALPGAELALGTGGTGAAQRLGTTVPPSLLPIVRRLPPHAKTSSHFARPNAFSKQLGRPQTALLHSGMISSLRHDAIKARVSLLGKAQ